MQIVYDGVKTFFKAKFQSSVKIFMDLIPDYAEQNKEKLNMLATDPPKTQSLVLHIPWNYRIFSIKTSCVMSLTVTYH